MSNKRGSHTELGRLLREAVRYLESTDLRRANEALELAGEEIATLRDATILPEPGAAEPPRE